MSARKTTPHTGFGAQDKIPPRHMDFGFSTADMPRYYVGDNPVITAVLTALSSAIPEGERFFVDAVRHFRHQITDPELGAQISGFIGQEAFHAKEHDAFNLALIKNGFAVDELEYISGLAIKAMQRCPKKFQLAATAALEHYTAIIGEQLLRDADMREKMAPLAQAFWTWHAMEETEHKSVAFDVYEKVSGSYVLRTGAMLAITSVYWPLVLFMVMKLVAEDDQPFQTRKFFSGLNYALGPKGFFTRLASKYLDYFKPGFHPSHHDTEALLAEWREKLFGKAGSLNDHRKKAVKRAA